MLPALLCCTLVSATTTQCTSFSAFAFYSHFLFSHFFQALLSFCCRVRASATRAKRKGLDNKNYEAYYLSALGFLFPFFPFATFSPSPCLCFLRSEGCEGMPKYVASFCVLSSKKG